ncbi:MAG: protein-export chaperone SecB [Alkalilacustris sp.]
MAETGNGGAAPANPQQPQAAGGAAAQPQVRVQILAQYIRDMSFENAFAQRGGKTDGVQPDIKVQVSLDARKRDDSENQYEVVTKYKISSNNKGDGAALFLLELEYAGVFLIEGVPQEQLHPFLLIECPRLLFPFARRIVSDVTRDGGFLPLNLDLIDFMALYRQELQRQAELRKTQGGVPS